MQAQNRDVPGLLASLRDAVKVEPTHREALFALGNVLQQVAGQAVQQGDQKGALAMYIEAAEAMRKLKAAYPELNENEKLIYSNAMYNDACAQNLQGQADKALAALEEAVASGFSDVGNLDQDNDLASLRDKPEFATIRANMAKNAEAGAKEQLAKGQTFAFDFQLTDLDGMPIKLADFKGKVLIVDFWGTWCPPCRAEIPHFVDLKKNHEKDGLEIVGLNYERVEAAKVNETIKNFMTANGMNYRCAVGDDATQQQVPNLTGYPTTLFIDRTGKVRLMLVGAQPKATLEAIVSVLLAEPAQDAGAVPAAPAAGAAPAAPTAPAASN